MYYGYNPNWCLAFVGFMSIVQIVIQSWNTVVTNGSPLTSLTGPVLSTNVWTHVVQTYSPTNGMRLYVNGVLSNQTTAFTYSASNTPVYLYLGSFPVPMCVPSDVICMGQYYSLADELRVFSREITAAKVYALVHP